MAAGCVADENNIFPKIYVSREYNNREIYIYICEELGMYSII